MRRQARSTTPLRVILLAMAAVAALLVTLPGAGSFAAWNASAPLGGSTTTGSLGIDDEALTAGDWAKDSTAFDPATDRLTPGDTLTMTIPGVGVTAVGNNLEASFDVSGAGLPAAIEDHIEVRLTSDPAPVRGADSDADGHQDVELTLTVTADENLPTDEQRVDLSHLTVTLTNGHAWSDTATLDAGTLATGVPHPGFGDVELMFNLDVDADKKVGFYLKNPAPGTVVLWNVFDGSDEIQTEAKDGLNEYDYSGTGKTGTAWVRVRGTFDGFGSSAQTAAQIGSLTHVQNWDDRTGSTDAADAFRNAQHLQYVSPLPSTLTDTSYAFANAGTKASSLQVLGWTAENAHEMVGMFSGATSFNQYDVPWDTSNVRSFSNMFKGATAFNGNIGGWDTSGAENMSNMFAGATSFNQDISRWKTSNVTTMQSMFEGARAFSQNLSGWDVAGVNNHKDFSKDSALTADQLPRWATTRAAAVHSPAAGGGDHDTAADDSTGETDATDADEQPAEPASDTAAPDETETPAETPTPEEPAEETPEEQVDPDQAVDALEEAWKQANESDTDEARQALQDAADAVDTLLGEGAADEIVQRLEDEAAAAADTSSAPPMATPEHEQAD